MFLESISLLTGKQRGTGFVLVAAISQPTPKLVASRIQK